MAEVTVSRKTLRRDIAKTARMPFFLRYKDQEVGFTAGGDSNASVASTSVFYCTNLTQEEGFWNNSYLYMVSTDAAKDGFERLIPNFNREHNAIHLEWPCDTDEVPSTDDKFEMFEMWPPSDVHDYINDAIRDSWRTFPDIVVDETFTITKRKRKYEFSEMAVQPAYVLQILAETAVNSVRGNVISSSENVGDTDVEDLTISNVSGIDTNWRVSYYYNAGAGQSFGITAVDGTNNILTLDATATTSPDTGTQFRCWDPTEQRTDWYPMLSVKFDTPEHPSWMEFQGEPSASWGLRYRVIYIAQPAELTSDTDTTTVPQYFVKNKAIAFMHDSLVGDNRADARAHSNIAEHYDQLARDYALRNPRRLPDGTVWTEGQFYSGYGLEANPLAWR
jgi:hypothetical protein